jgi:hypothetical protein
MDSNNKLSLEEVNYRKVDEIGPNCIHCNNSDDNLDVNDDGTIISKCHIFDIDVDELHICDWIR